MNYPPSYDEMVASGHINEGDSYSDKLLSPYQDQYGNVCKTEQATVVLLAAILDELKRRV